MSLFVHAQNQTIDSFSTAKKRLQEDIYQHQDERFTLYCHAGFDKQKNIFANPGFVSEKYKKRAKRVEWEHVVPAENFGRNFSEWRDGHNQCVNSKKQQYKGRRCAEKVNNEYRYMQADMYNLYPAIGSVNASRRNYNFAMLGDIPSDFGSCAVKINKQKVEPSSDSRGIIARTYLYMEATYPHYHMSRQQRQLMNAWHKSHPVTEWECQRGKRIKSIQGNDNHVLKASCQAAGY